MKRLAVFLLLVSAACSGSAPRTAAPRIVAPSRADYPAKVWKAASEPIVSSPVSLERFGSCDPAVAYLKREAVKRVQAWGVDGLGNGMMFFGGDVVMARTGSAPAAVPAPAPAAASSAEATGYSRTNNQEAGVDEPDMVKSDGTRILAIANGRLTWVGVRDGTATLEGSMVIPGGGYGYEMLVDGSRALLFGNAWVEDKTLPVAWQSRQRSSILVVEVSDPHAMRVLATLTVDGSYVSARMIDGVARVVLQSQPSGFQFSSPANDTKTEQRAAIARNKRIVRSSKLDQWLPKYRLVDRRGPARKVSEGRVSSCDRVHRTKQFSGFGTTTVMTIDPDHPSPKAGTTVLGDAGVVYASPSHLYVATTRWQSPQVADTPNGKQETQIHAFDITDQSEARYVGSGLVAGHVLNQWSMSEYKGHLRVASTIDDFSGDGKSQSYVTVLSLARGALVLAGRVGGLGRGERIYGVRFMDELGYVVTFRQVDPLYVLDLSNPAKPVVRGSLKIPGYSAYLHPVGKDLLLGVGAAANTEGRREGVQLSLFDVSDPSKPNRIAFATVDHAYTDVEYTHLAFLWWAPRKLAVIPVNGPIDGDESRYGSRMMGFHVDASDGIDRAGVVAHEAKQEEPQPDGGMRTMIWQPPVQRSLVIGDRLFTMSEIGLMTSTLDDLGRTGWIAWPKPPAQ